MALDFGALLGLALFGLGLGGVVGLAVYLTRAARLSRLFFALPGPARAALIRRPSRLEGRGAARRITYLSCRMAGGTLDTGLKSDPARQIARWRKTLGLLRRTVLDNGGVIERFGAGGFCAYWNAPLDDARPAARACEAASRMIALVREQRGLMPALEMTIGLATGPAIAGLYGGAYSVAGEAVARAEQLRGLCGDYGFAVLADEETFAEAGEDYALLEIRNLPERDGPQKLYAHLGDAASRASPKFRALSTYHTRIFAALDGDRFDEARELIVQAGRLSGASPRLYALYLDRRVLPEFKEAV